MQEVLGTQFLARVKVSIAQWHAKSEGYYHSLRLRALEIWLTVFEVSPQIASAIDGQQHIGCSGQAT